MGLDVSYESGLKSKYQDIRLRALGQVLQKFVTKKDFFELLHPDDFQYFFVSVIPDARWHFEKYGNASMGPLEVFSLMYLFCEHRSRPIDDKLDALISLVQFQRIPDSAIDFTYSAPRESDHLDEVKLLFSCINAAISKVFAGAESVSDESLAAVADGLFLQEKNFEKIVSERQEWQLIKNEMLGSQTIMVYLNKFVNALFLPPLAEQLERYCTALEVDLCALGQPSKAESARSHPSTEIMELMHRFLSRTSDLQLQQKELSILESSVRRVTKHGQVDEAVFVYVMKAFCAFVIISHIASNEHHDIFADHFVALLKLSAFSSRNYAIESLQTERKALMTNFLALKKCDESCAPPMPLSFWMDFKCKPLSIRLHVDAAAKAQEQEATVVVNLTFLEVDGAIRTKLEQRLGRVAPELDPRAVLMALDSELVEEQISHMVREFISAADVKGTGTIESDAIIDSETLDATLAQLAQYFAGMFKSQQAGAKADATIPQVDAAKTRS